MKAKGLIKVLEAVDPESEVDLQLGRDMDDEYRDMCAKVQIESGECLDHLRILFAVIDDINDGMRVNLVLGQSNYCDCDLPDIARHFDEKYNMEEPSC